MDLCVLPGHLGPDPWQPPPGLNPASSLFVCPDEITRHACERERAKACSLIDRPLYRYCEAAAADFARQRSLDWFIDEEGRDISEVNGVSLGNVLYGNLWLYSLFPFYHFVNMVGRFIDAEQPGTLWSVAGVPWFRGRLLQALGAQRGLPVRELGSPAERPAEAGRAAGPAITVWPLKHQVWKRRLWNLAARSHGQRKPRALVSHYSFIREFVAALGADPAFEPMFYTSPDPKTLLGLPERRRWRFLGAYAAGIPDGAGRFAERWERLASSASYRARFLFQGVDVWPEASCALRAVLRYDVPLVAQELAKLQVALDRDPADVVVVPFDTVPTTRLLIEEAKRRGIPTVLPIHGLPHNYSPFYDSSADLLLAGGPGQRDLYAEERAPEKVAAPGLSILDRYARLPAGRPPQGPPWNILLLSHMCTIEEAMAPALEALAELPEARVTLKLHPGESLEQYRTILGARAKGVRIVRDEPLAGLLEESHVVVSFFSSALLEAMAMGKPIVCINLEGAIVAPPFDGSSGIPVQVDAAGMARAVRDMFAAGVPQRADYAQILEKYAGRMDGKNAQRGLEAVRRMVRR